MSIFGKFASVIGSCRALGRVPQKLDAIVEGIDNQSRLTNDKSAALIDGVTYLASRINHLIDRIDHVVELQQAQLILQREEVDAIDELILSIKPRGATYPTVREPAAKLDLDRG